MLYVFTRVFSSTNSPKTSNIRSKTGSRTNIEFTDSEQTSINLSALWFVHEAIVPYARRLFVPSDVPGQVSLLLKRELTHTSYLQTFDV
jgi:hypothetical protein